MYCQGRNSIRRLFSDLFVKGVIVTESSIFVVYRRGECIYFFLLRVSLSVSSTSYVVIAVSCEKGGNVVELGSTTLLRWMSLCRRSVLYDEHLSDSCLVAAL